ncbi:MAG: O-methyltransferase [Crocinitomicaceae bacterium]|jgi:predicted O-methyltransferase YrrM|nr:O-methyltransferase [Crocinitomicaceae bacterium]
MEFIDEQINQYSLDHTTAESDRLNKINRETHLEVLQPRMLSGHLQGRFLSMISKLMKPKYVLEIGTYTGYSALCLAEGLPQEGRLTTIDVNEELASRVQGYFNESPYGKQIDMRIGNALDIIPTLDGNFDLVFIDADKENYANYLDLVIPRMNKGGVIIGDNVLWSGKVVQDVKANDSSTKAIMNFNQQVHLDERLENVLLPLRDGLMMARVK